MGMVHVETIEVGAGGAASIEFTSIPQDGVDLQVVISARSTTTENQFVIRFNNSSSGYSGKRLEGSGSAAFSEAGYTAGILIYGLTQSSWTANTFSNLSCTMSNYASSNYKSVSLDSVSENNATLSFAEINAALWSNTAAITSVKIAGISGNLAQYSTASLYKITAD